LPGATGVPPAIPLPAAPLPRSARPNPSPLGLASGAAFSWRPELEVSVFSLDPALDVSLSPHDWSSAVVRPTTLTLFSARCTGSLTAAVSLPIAPPTLKVRSFQFPQLGGWRKKDVPPSPVGPAPAALPSLDPAFAVLADRKPSARTRITVPGDVIKLEDRLFYVLQPSLETLIGEGSLAFPNRPFPYQFEGVAFLYPRHAAVLADEMGLGKTMQAITAVRLLLHTGEITSMLLVCPKPLVTNWLREFNLWAPELPVTVIEGEQAKRRWQWQQSETPIKIANYELLQRDRDLVAELGLQFDLVVLDEAQRIKNRASVTSACVRDIPRRRSWALTGTPVENSPQDLVGIFEFVAPGQLSDTMKPRRMGLAASDYILRRTKDKVLADLPPKMFRDADVELTSQQRRTYQLAEKEGVLRLTEMGESATIQHVFELILRLKQICNFDPATGESTKFERLAADLDEVVSSGRKAIIFSQWVSSLDTLAGRLQAFNPLLYHGRVPSADRDSVIEQFRDDPRRHIMLLSYGAGGVGLNLQFAGYVFLFDRWWNPAVEDQAINRAHRIGAVGPVTVTRFLALETIEQRIDQILREKREIFDTIFSDVEPQRKPGLTQQEIFGLFKLRCPSGPIDLAA
jgi:SNF2 family DNA or RNA helicase